MNGVKEEKLKNNNMGALRNKYTIDDIKSILPTVTNFPALCLALGISERGNNIRTLEKKIIKNNLDISHFKNGNTKYPLQELTEYVKNSKSISEVCRKLGVSDTGRSHLDVKNYIIGLGYDISHFTGQLWNKGFTHHENTNIYCADIYQYLNGDKKIATTKLRDMLIDRGLKTHCCEKCGNTKWNELPIPLQLHHIDGDRYNNHLNNLMLLCPNCHAQTDNYCSKNSFNTIKKTEKTIKQKTKAKK